METERQISTSAKTLGIILIVLVGLFNFHIPHFLIEARRNTGIAGNILELVLLANVLGALAAALGIYRNARWGWRLGIFIAAFSFLLYLAQETIGLPGLPQDWLEPSRIVSLIIEAAYVILAVRVLRSSPG